MTRIGIYCRQSYAKKGSAENKNEAAVERQESTCREFTAHRGEVVDLFVDNDRSATSGRRREEYDRMVDMIRSGKLDEIAAFTLDRLNREPAQFESLIFDCLEAGVVIVTSAGEFDPTNDESTLTGRIMTAVAKFETSRKIRRQKAANVQRASTGRAWWPQRPFGFDMPVRIDRYSFEPPQHRRAEADAIAGAYAAVIEGESLKAIARSWNAAGLTTPQGGQWTSVALRACLLSPRNAAKRTYQPDKRQPPQIVGDADWQPIVTEEVWRSVVALLTNPARKIPGSGFNVGRKHLLTGIAGCGSCGAKLGSAIPSNTKRPTYTCKRCLKVSRCAADVDRWVRAHVVEALGRDLDVLTGRVDVDTAGLVARLREIETERNQAAAMVKTKSVTLAQLAILNADYDSEEATIAAQMQDSEKTGVLAGFAGAEDAGAVFDSLSLDRKRAVIRLICSITVHRGQVPRRPFDESLVVVEPNY